MGIVFTCITNRDVDDGTKANLFSEAMYMHIKPPDVWKVTFGELNVLRVTLFHSVVMRVKPYSIHKIDGTS